MAEEMMKMEQTAQEVAEKVAQTVTEAAQTAAAAAAEAAEAASEATEAAAEPVESMEDYKEELEASFRQIHVGDILTGTVISVDETAVTLDLDFYAPGVIRAEDMSKDPKFSLLADVHVGDQIKATVVKRDDGAGNILLSCVEAAETLGWESLKEAMDTKKVLTVKVSETVNKGVVAYAEGIRGFIPASKLALDYVEDTSSYVNQTLEVQVITVDKAAKKLVLSAKDVLRDKEKERLAHKVSMMVPGTILEGRVESLQAYGAFVDLGDGLTGLVHVSQISNKRISKPSEVLKVGDTVKVKVLGTKQGKISLSMRDAAESAGTTEDTDEISGKQVEEFSSHAAVGTSLGDLLKGFKL